MALPDLSTDADSLTVTAGDAPDKPSARALRGRRESGARPGLPQEMRDDLVDPGRGAQGDDTGDRPEGSELAARGTLQRGARVRGRNGQGRRRQGDGHEV